MAHRILKIAHKGLEARSLRLGQFILWQPSTFVPITAVGGSIGEFTDSEGVAWRVHTAVASTTFTVTGTGTDSRIECFLLGAGGGAYSGAGSRGGCSGGGAGELIPGIGFPVSVAANLYQLNVGVGGTNASATIQPRGGDTEAFGLIARGGGRGCQRIEEGDRDGGCGAGGAVNADKTSDTDGTAAPPGLSIANNGLGNPGNAAWATSSGDDWITGGGGGTGSPSVSPGYGGGGTLIDFDGTPRHYGGGGAGQAKDGSILPGGIGGGGDSRQDGIDGLGGGGGGYAPGTGQGGKGGNGRIMVRYPLNRLPSYW